MSDSVEQMIRNAYQAFGQGDFDGYLSACTDDWTMHVPGNNRGSGDFQGRDGLMAIVATVGEVAGSSFREEVHDVLANDTHAVVLATHSLERDGRQHRYNTVHVYHLRDGRLAEVWECPADPAAFDDAWGPR
jgi:ketosteroid isomerase-like protein